MVSVLRFAATLVSGFSRRSLRPPAHVHALYGVRILPRETCLCVLFHPVLRVCRTRPTDGTSAFIRRKITLL